MKCKCGKPQRIVVKGEQLCWDCFDEQEKAKKDEMPAGYPYGYLGV